MKNNIDGFAASGIDGAKVEPEYPEIKWVFEIPGDIICNGCGSDEFYFIDGVKCCNGCDQVVEANKD